MHSLNDKLLKWNVVILSFYSLFQLVLNVDEIVPVFDLLLSYTVYNYGVYLLYCLLTLLAAPWLYSNNKIVNVSFVVISIVISFWIAMISQVTLSTLIHLSLILVFIFLTFRNSLRKHGSNRGR